MSNRKYRAPVEEGIGAGPHKSAWMSSRGEEAREMDKEKWILWLLAQQQALQTSTVLFELYEILHVWKISLSITAERWPNLWCHNIVVGWVFVRNTWCLELVVGELIDEVGNL